MKIPLDFIDLNQDRQKSGVTRYHSRLCNVRRYNFQNDRPQLHCISLNIVLIVLVNQRCGPVCIQSKSYTRVEKHPSTEYSTIRATATSACDTRLLEDNVSKRTFTSELRQPRSSSGNCRHFAENSIVVTS